MWKNRKRFINDWAKIWIWCISLIAFAHMVLFVNAYATNAKQQLIERKTEEWQQIAVAEIERSIQQWQ